MKKTVEFATIIMVTIFAVTTIAFAWGNKNATGRITSLDQAGSSPFVNVIGYTENGYLWLGFSFKCGNGGWEHRDPVKVKGNFTERFNMRLCPQGYTQIRSCLWKGKDGHLMEGRVDCMDD